MFQPAKRKESFTSATRELFANPCFIILLVTGIGRMAIYQAFVPFGYLYFRDIGVSYTQIGLLELVYSLILIPTILVGSYFSDLLPHHRSKFAGAHDCIWGIMCIIYAFVTDFWCVLTVYVTAGFAMTFQPAARTYLLELSGEKKHLAMGLYSFYRIPLLLMFTALLWSFRVYGFILGMRIALFFAGIVIIILGLVRWLFLTDPTTPLNKPKKNASLTKLVKENAHTLRFIWRIAPAFVLITCIDAVSDQLYNFLIYFFLNETASLSEAEILTGRLILDAISVPLILWLAFRINRSKGKRAFFLLYLIPTITIGLLIVSLSHPVIMFNPNKVPVAFTKLAFIAYSIKYISDFLWLLILAPLAMSFVPRENATKAIGISWLFIYSSRFMAAPVAGWLYQQNHTIFLMFSILTLNCVILFVIFWQAPTETKINQLR